MPTIYETETEQLILYRLEEAAAYLGVSTRTIRQYIHDQRLPAQKIGNRVYIWDGNLSAFVRGAHSRKDRHKVEPPAFTQDFPPDPFFGPLDDTRD